MDGAGGYILMGDTMSDGGKMVIHLDMERVMHTLWIKEKRKVCMNSKVMVNQHL